MIDLPTKIDHSAVDFHLDRHAAYDDDDDDYDDNDDDVPSPGDKKTKFFDRLFQSGLPVLSDFKRPSFSVQKSTFVSTGLNSLRALLLMS